MNTICVTFVRENHKETETKDTYLETTFLPVVCGSAQHIKLLEKM